MITKKISTLLLLALLFTGSAFAQSAAESHHSKHYSKEPLWIRMMDDPQVNYHETIKAFRLYWKERVLPKEPFETDEMEVFEREVGLIKEGESEKEKVREEKQKLKKQKPNEINYAAEVRAFKGWLQSVQPWLREDGSIISAEEQQAIINKQHQDLKELEKRDGKK